MKDLVLVYGSLKNGFPNHRVIRDSEFITDTHTVKKYHMFSMGGYPAVVEDLPYHYIAGELYRVDKKTMIELDYLESSS